jgi:hypothetical protein
MKTIPAGLIPLDIQALIESDGLCITQFSDRSYWARIHPEPYAGITGYSTETTYPTLQALFTQIRADFKTLNEGRSLKFASIYA